MRILFLAVFFANTSAACYPTIADLLIGGAGSENFHPVAPISQFAGLVKQTGYVQFLGNLTQNFTVFVPSDWAFNSSGFQPRFGFKVFDITNYHILAGATILSQDLKDSQTVIMDNGSNITITVDKLIRINDYADVVQANIVACNGVIHIVDHVLVPPVLPSGNRFGILPTIADLASQTDELSTLLSLVKTAGLADVLSNNFGPGNDQSYTVFAPTNKAFTEANLSSSLTPFQIADILQYHLLPSRVLSTDLGAAEEVTTVHGADLQIFQSDGNVLIQAFASVARVTEANIQGSNGVVHIIDSVLIPVSIGGGEKRPAALLMEKKRSSQ